MSGQFQTALNSSQPPAPYDPGKHHPDQLTATIVADIEHKGIPTINMGEAMPRLHAVDDAALTERADAAGDLGKAG